MENAAQTTTLAISLYERGFVRAALGTLTRGASRYPDATRVWEMQGILLHREQDLARAERALETASLLGPLSVAGELALAECYSRSGHPESATAIYEHLLANRNIPTARLAEIASGMARCGHVHQALAVCRTAAEREPENEGALFGMAHYMSLLLYPAEQILPLLEKVVELAPDQWQYRFALVGWLARTGCNRQAYHHLSAIPTEQFQAINCACCVQRLLRICRQAGDEALSETLAHCLQSVTRSHC